MVTKCLQYFHPSFQSAAFILAGLAASAYAQQTTSERIVQCNELGRVTDAVLMTGVAVAGQTVECGLFVKPHAGMQPVTPFRADNDWIQHLTISLINRTEKTISYASITLMFPDNVSNCHAQVCPMEQIHLGQIPEVDAYGTRHGRQLGLEQRGRTPLGWEPGKILTVNVADYVSDLPAKLAGYEQVNDVKKMGIYLDAFFFSDGMRWSQGIYSDPIPEAPGRFKNRPEMYFPGKSSKNYPPGYDN